VQYILCDCVQPSEQLVELEMSQGTESEFSAKLVKETYLMSPQVGHRYLDCSEEQTSQVTAILMSSTDMTPWSAGSRKKNRVAAC